MLLQPFAAAAILSRTWNFALSVGLVGLLLAFIIREPLLVLARQRWLWREDRPESRLAKRALSWQIPALAACGVFLWLRIPRTPLIVLATVGAALTGLAIWMALVNRQRSAALQAASAFGLGSGAFLAALAGTQELPRWVWLLWGVLSLHSFAGILIVHARLALRAGRSIETRTPREVWTAWAGIGTLVITASWASSSVWGATAGVLIWLSVVQHLFELYRLKKPDGEQERLQRVGVRMLVASLTHTAAATVLFWEMGNPALPG